MNELKPVLEGEPWWFQFVAEPSDVPDAVRYRRLLKYALRVLGLKCLKHSGKGPECHEAIDKDKHQ